MATPTPKNCPCTSGKAYEACCGPLHRGERKAGTAEELMRSRYAAFALKLVPYLYETFHSKHPDRVAAKPQTMRELRDSCDNFRYMGLRVIDHRSDEATGKGKVLFVAKVFERGRDRSFVELSDFALEDGQWRYVDGRVGGLTELRPLLDTMTVDTFPTKAAPAPT